MKEIKGDIWAFHRRGQAIVIPTNGDVNGRAEGVMGRGLARQAKLKFPTLAKKVGTNLLVGDNRVYYYRPPYHLFTFPVKHHYYQKADIPLIDNSARQLVELVDELKLKRVYLPRVGCGNGRLLWGHEVRPMLLKRLDDRFTVVELEID